MMNIGKEVALIAVNRRHGIKKMEVLILRCESRLLPIGPAGVTSGTSRLIQ